MDCQNFIWNIFNINRTSFLDGFYSNQRTGIYFSANMTIQGSLGCNSPFWFQRELMMLIIIWKELTKTENGPFQCVVIGLELYYQSDKVDTTPFIGSSSHCMRHGYWWYTVLRGQWCILRKCCAMRSPLISLTSLNRGEENPPPPSNQTAQKLLHFCWGKWESKSENCVRRTPLINSDRERG